MRADLCILLVLVAIWACVAADTAFTKGTYGVEDFAGYVSAFGDFNSDKHADMFVVEQDATTKAYKVVVYLWNGRQKKYIKLDTKNTITEPLPITSLVPGDFNYDGRLDLMVLGTSANQLDLSESYAHIYLGFLNDFSPTYASLSPAPIGEPVAIDSNNDLKMDWYGLSSLEPAPTTYTTDNTNTNTNTDNASPVTTATHASASAAPAASIPARTLWLYTGNDNLDFPQYTASRHDLPPTHAYSSLCAGALPVSVDVNGDCLADLVVPACRPGKELSNLARSTLESEKEGTSAVGVGATPVLSEDMVWEIWINRKNKPSSEESGKYLSERWHYELHASHKAYIGMQQPAFYDVNADGNVDMVVPLCVPLDSCSELSQVHVWYNMQIRMCGRIGDSGCRGQQDLCSADEQFDLGGLRIEAPNRVAVTTTTPFALPSSLFPLSATNPPVLARLGDAALSGHPHLLLPLTQSKTTVDTHPTRTTHTTHAASVRAAASTVSTAGTTAGAVTDVASIPSQVSVFVSTPCTAATCTPAAVERELYTFMPSTRVSTTTIFTNPLSTSAGESTVFPNAYAAAFIDVGNTGNLDLLVLYTNTTAPAPTAIATASTSTSTSTSVSPRVYARLFANTLDEDAYFLTTLASNGVCDAWCSGNRGEFPNPKPYGVSQVGTTFKFTVTSLSGAKTPRQTVQQPQQSSLALATPYVVSGLGRTSNYLEEMFAGVTIASTHYRLWVAMIPNSQVVVFPHPPSSPASWTLEQFIFPTDRLLAVSIALLVTLAVNGIIILVLRKREKDVEKKEKQRQRHLFAF